jgi:hypothetical protein
MKRLAITLALLCASTGLTKGESSYDEWKAMSRVEKVAFLVGFINGAVAMDNNCRSPLRLDLNDPDHIAVYVFSPPGATFDQLVDGINHFYSDYRNENVFIGYAISYVDLELSGASAETLDRYRRRILHPSP